MKAVADFIAKLTPSLDTEILEGLAPVVDDKWGLNVDGLATSHARGAGIIIIASGGEELEYAIKFKFKATNNEAEYAVNGLKIAHKLGAKKVRVRSNSKLIGNQVLGEYEAREERMVEY